MSQPPASRPVGCPLGGGGVEPLRRRTRLPSWLISAVLHFLGLMLVVVAPLSSAPRRGAMAERTADVGIVLKNQEGDSQYYQSGDGGGTEQAAAAATAGTEAGGVDELLSDQPPTDPSTRLPSSLKVIGPGALGGGAVGTAIGADRGAGRSGRAPSGWGGGTGRTRVFGVEGEGYKFAYVFDRSGSMEGRPLQAAKAELIASLESLADTHQFQIIFYNEQALRFSPTGEPNRLFFATERNKSLAAKFIGSIVADDGTDHEQALMLAINLRPDVIFLLTDADEPKLWPGQLAKITRRAEGITINAIEFGFGPQADPNNFLVRLARENGGRHAYVDISNPIPVQRQ